jgi:hypothetical protein
MKTITTFFLGMLSSFLALFLIGMAVKYITLSTYLYGNVNETATESVIYDFQFTMLLALVQLLCAIALIAFSAKCFQIFNGFYNKLIKTRKDKDIYKQAENTRYDELYAKLKDTNIPDLQDSLIKDFFKRDINSDQVLAGFMNYLKTKHSKTDRGFKEEMRERSLSDLVKDL